jgi:hypothetical protein
MSAVTDPVAALFAAHKWYVAAARALSKARGGPRSELLKADREFYAALEKRNALRTSARDAFAASRGWHYDKKLWCHVGEDSARGMYSRRFVKHPEFFRDRDGKVVGLITHTDAKMEEVAAYAARSGYTAEQLPFSWEEPGYYDAVLFTLKAGARWPA